MQTDANYRVGFLASAFGHVLLLVVFLGHFGGLSKDFGKPIVYSVSIEGGKKLGGRTQVAKDTKKTPVAPPKNVSQKQAAAVTPKEEEKVVLKKKVEEKKPEPKPVKKVEKAPVKKVEVKKKAPPKEKAKPVQKAAPVKTTKSYEQYMQRYLGESSNAGGSGFGAASLGGSGMGGGTVVPPEVLQYINTIESIIKSGWGWPLKTSPLKARARFYISADGRITKAEIASGSGNAAYDDSVQRAIFKASPLPAPPGNVYSQYFKYVDMTFDSSER